MQNRIWKLRLRPFISFFGMICFGFCIFLKQHLKARDEFKIEETGKKHLFALHLLFSTIRTKSTSLIGHVRLKKFLNLEFFVRMHIMANTIPWDFCIEQILTSVMGWNYFLLSYPKSITSWHIQISKLNCYFYLFI